MKNNRPFVSLTLVVLLVNLILGFPLNSFGDDVTPGNGTGPLSFAVIEQRLQAIEEKLRLLEDRLAIAQGETVTKVGRSTGAQAALTSQTIDPPIEDRFEALDQKLRIFERRRELEEETLAAKLKESPIVTASGKDGFGLKSSDNNFQLKVGGYIQGDSRFYTEGDPALLLGSSTFVMRRIRPIFQGTVYKYFDFRIMPDFGNGQALVQDAYLDFNYLPGAKVRFGKMKPPVGLERLQSGSENLFVERALPTDLVPNRDVGVQVLGENLGGGVFNYALGVFNGVADGGSGDLDTNNTKDFAGRVFLHPFRTISVEPLKGLGIGFAGTAGSQQGLLPVLRTPAQGTFFNYSAGTLAAGNRYRLSPQAYYYVGPFGLLGEYVQSVQDVQKGNTVGEINNQAWQIAASFVLTGEKASYRQVTPRKQFSPGTGNFGAVELAGRYTQLDIDNDAFLLNFADPTKSAQRASTWTAGVNWYFNRNLKFQVNYEQTHFKGGSIIGDRTAEKVVLSRFQIYF
jgi:phosphate-selective porin OprO and OprP